MNEFKIFKNTISILEAVSYMFLTFGSLLIISYLIEGFTSGEGKLPQIFLTLISTIVCYWLCVFMGAVIRFQMAKYETLCDIKKSLQKSDSQKPTLIKS